MAGSLSCYDGLLDTYQTYKLRDRGPAGGWIFYINPNYEEDGWRYLEAAPADLPGNPWGTNPHPIPGADKTSIGSGNQNTIDIVNSSDPMNIKAADICFELTLNGYNDWFLPSKDELDLMCWNLRGKRDPAHPQYVTSDNPDVPDVSGGGTGGFVTTEYWSSSEASDADSWIMNFSDGKSLTAGKGGGYRIRPIRAF